MIAREDVSIGTIIISDHFLETYRWLKVVEIHDGYIQLESKDKSKHHFSWHQGKLYVPNGFRILNPKVKTKIKISQLV